MSTKPWYTGMTSKEIEEAIRSGTAPGSTEPGGVIEVTNGFLDRKKIDSLYQRMKELIEEAYEKGHMDGLDRKPRQEP